MQPFYGMFWWLVHNSTDEACSEDMIRAHTTESGP